LSRQFDPGWGRSKLGVIGLILCEDKGDERVELLQLDKSGIRVASYLTELPPKALLQEKLRAAAALARKRLENQANSGELL
jgi:hypothetical protein